MLLAPSLRAAGGEAGALLVGSLVWCGAGALPCGQLAFAAAAAARGVGELRC